jgi:hypothetical protein
MTRYDDTTLRRYVLGAATEDESLAIEHEYFDRADVLDRVSAVEEDLIDDYLSARLAAADRDRFERHYMATPRHRTRVAVARALRSAAPQASTARRRLSWPSWTATFGAMRTWTPIGQAALAAALLLLVAGAAWRFGPASRVTPVAPVAGTMPAPVSTARTSDPPAAPQGAEPPATGATSAPPVAPTVVALSLSPISVRAAGDTATLTIPAGTDIVALRLEGDAPDRSLKARAVVRTVGGSEQWRGPATSDRDSQTTARIEIPAERLPADDYIVELFGTDRAGRESERYRYFFRVRAR